MGIFQVNLGVYWSKGWWRWWWQLDYRSYKSCKAPVKSSPPTNQHPVKRYHFVVYYLFLEIKGHYTVYHMSNLFLEMCTYFNVFYFSMCSSSVAWWLSGVIIRSWVRILASPVSSATLGKLLTHVPLSPSSLIWYQPMGGDVLRLGR